MDAIVTQRLIVNWRKKTVKKTHKHEKGGKHLILETLSDGALQQFFVL
jgi:hypothetical protein